MPKLASQPGSAQAKGSGAVPVRRRVKSRGDAPVEWLLLTVNPDLMAAGSFRQPGLHIAWMQTDSAFLKRRSEQLFKAETLASSRRIDHLFALLLGIQWLGGIGIAAWFSTGDGGGIVRPAEHGVVYCRHPRAGNHRAGLDSDPQEAGEDGHPPCRGREPDAFLRAARAFGRGPHGISLPSICFAGPPFLLSRLEGDGDGGGRRRRRSLRARGLLAAVDLRDRRGCAMALARARGLDRSRGCLPHLHLPAPHARPAGDHRRQGGTRGNAGQRRADGHRAGGAPLAIQSRAGPAGQRAAAGPSRKREPLASRWRSSCATRRRNSARPTAP